MPLQVVTLARSGCFGQYASGCGTGGGANGGGQGQHLERMGKGQGQAAVRSGGELCALIHVIHVTRHTSHVTRHQAIQLFVKRLMEPPGGAGKASCRPRLPPLLFCELVTEWGRGGVSFLGGRDFGDGEYDRICACRKLRVTRHTSCVTRHTSRVTRYSLQVTRHTSHVTRHTSCSAQRRHEQRFLPA